MTDKSIILKEVRLNNHCPECYSNDDLTLTFSQKIVDNQFYKANLQRITFLLSCKKCNSVIFPVRWTNDIEQVVDYHKRATNPKPKSLKLKKVTWVLLLVIVLTALGIVLFKIGVFK